MSQPEPQLKSKHSLSDIEIQSPNRYPQPAHSKQNAEIGKPSTQSKIKMANHPHLFYEETYYLTSLRENYLVLISDTKHVIEMPVGLIKENLSIGDPVKLKLQLDTRRAEADKKKFLALQEQLVKEYSQD